MQHIATVEFAINYVSEVGLVLTCYVPLSYDG